MIGLLLLLAAPLFAHSFPSDLIELTAHADRVDGSLRVHGARLPETAPEAQALLSRGLSLKADDRPLEVRVLGTPETLPDESRRVRFAAAWEHPPHRLALHCRLYPDIEHEMSIVTLEQAGEEAAPPALLSEDEPDRTFTLAAYESRWDAFKDFLRQGVRHIFIGPDHIAFILGLILLGGSLWRVAGIVTAFTLAHSVTLALAVLGVFAPSAKIIEPLIALSIVVIAAENLRHGRPLTPRPLGGDLSRGERDIRGFIAFGFGFVHGFGFAEVLRDFGLPRAVLGVSLLSFNLGVEVGQLAIVALALPVFAFLRRRGWRVERISWLIGAAGAYWFFARVLS